MLNGSINACVPESPLSAFKSGMGQKTDSDMSSDSIGRPVIDRPYGEIMFVNLKQIFHSP